MGEDMSLCEYRGQRITSGTWFSSSILMRQDLASFCHNTYSKTVSVQMVINTLNLLNPCLSINFLSVVYNICALHLGPSNTILSLPQIAHLYLWAQIYNYCFMHWCLQPYRNNIQQKERNYSPEAHWHFYSRCCYPALCSFLLGLWVNCWHHFISAWRTPSTVPCKASPLISIPFSFYLEMSCFLLNSWRIIFLKKNWMTFFRIYMHFPVSSVLHSLWQGINC